MQQEKRDSEREVSGSGEAVGHQAATGETGGTQLRPDLLMLIGSHCFLVMGLQTHLLPLEFTDCLTDSPYFRENLHAHEKELELTSNQIKGMIKQVKELLEAAKGTSRILFLSSSHPPALQSYLVPSAVWPIRSATSLSTASARNVPMTRL